MYLLSGGEAFWILYGKPIPVFSVKVTLTVLTVCCSRSCGECVFFVSRGIF